MAVDYFETEGGVTTYVGYKNDQNFTINLASYTSTGYADVEYSMEAWATDMPGGTHVSELEFVLGSGASIFDPFESGGGVQIDDSGLCRVSAVPLPPSILLLISGLLGIVSFKNLKKMILMKG